MNNSLMRYLPALMPGNLESLRTNINTRCPRLAGSPNVQRIANKAIFLRRITSASLLIYAFSGQVSLTIENKTAKDVVALVSVAFATIAAISTRGCLKTVEELELLALG